MEVICAGLLRNQNLARDGRVDLKVVLSI